MKNKPLIFLLALTFLFLLSGSSVVFADDLQDGLDAYERKDYETAHKLLLPLAEQGSAEAHYSLGLLYDEGLEGAPDYKEVVKWYRLAAEQKHEAAQFALETMYFNPNILN